MSSGTKVYLAYRQVREIFRSGEKSISDAIRKGVAAWAIDDDTLRQMRAQGIKYVGVLVRENGAIWLTSTEAYFSPAAKILNFTTRGGALQRYLPLKYFRRRGGKAKL